MMVTTGARGFNSSVLVEPANKVWPYQMFVLRESWGAVKGKPPKGNGYYRYRSKDGRKWESTGEFVNDPMKGARIFRLARAVHPGTPLSP